MKELNKFIVISSLVIVLISLSCAWLAYYIQPAQWSWSNLLLSLAVALFQLFLGILVVNFYLKNKESRQLNNTSLRIIIDSVKLFHDNLLEIMQRELGAQEYESLIKEYESHERNPKAISDSKIKSYIKAINDSYKLLLGQIEACTDYLLLISVSGALSSNSKCLYLCLEGLSIKFKLRKLDINNSNDYRKIFEYLEDFDAVTTNLCIELHKA